MKKLILAGITMILAITNLSLSAQVKNFTLSTEKPVAGEQVGVIYNPKGTVLEGKKKITATVYQFCNYQWRKNDIVLEKKDSIWTANYLLPADASLVAFKFKSGKSVDIGQSMAYGWLLFGKDGKNAFYKTAPLAGVDVQSFAESDTLYQDKLGNRYNYKTGQKM